MGFWAAGDSVTTVVCLTDDTGAASDADSLPTGTLYLNGAANGAAVTVTDIGTGRYRVTWTNPGANGNVVSVVLAFTMGGIASQATIWEDRLAATPYSGTPPTPPTAVEIADAVTAALTIPTAAQNAAETIAEFVALVWSKSGSTQTLKDGDGNTLGTSG